MNTCCILPHHYINTVELFEVSDLVVDNMGLCLMSQLSTIRVLVLFGEGIMQGLHSLAIDTDIKASRLLLF